jgi:peptide/nickel transport system permease protein
MAPVLLIVSMLAFGLRYVLPGDPAVAILGENAGNQQTYLALRHDLGLDQPLYVQYMTWLGKVVQGDLGHSIRTSEPVSVVLLARVPVSLYLGFAGLLVGLVLGLSVAKTARRRKQHASTRTAHAGTKAICPDTSSPTEADALELSHLASW